MSNCKRALLASMAACLIGVTSAWGEIVVITHRANPLTELTAEQLEKIFLRKVQTFPDGKSAVPLLEEALSLEPQWYTPKPNYSALMRRELEEAKAIAAKQAD